MRTLGTFVVVSLLSSGCGGAGSSSAPPAAPSSAAGADESGGDDASRDGNPDDAPSTTTLAIGDAGTEHGTRLIAPRPTASTQDSAVAARGRHDPGRGPSDIRALVLGHRDEARQCYDTALASHPEIAGELVVAWTIDPTGKVTQVSADASRSQITDPGVIACVSDVVRRIQFAASPGGFETKAFYPFNFHPHRPPAPPAP